jgi:HD-GYP domain-containing protein (c-di-GMP phosphodiesterase class II)
VEALKRERLAIVDFPSLQSRDAALYHNESVAAFAVALLRALRSGGGSEAEAAADIDEAELALAALLHDVGKHALDADRLNHPSLSGEERNTLRDDMLDATVAVLERFGFAALAPAIRGLYRFESSRGAEGEYGATVEILAAADIYDALTAPKRYKGAPWRIAGALEELTRLPYCQARERAIFTAFVKLMKPKETAVRAGARPQIMLR